MEKCASCAAERDRMKGLASLLAQTPQEKAPKGLQQLLLQQAAERDLNDPVKVQRKYAPHAALAGTAALLFLGIGLMHLKTDSVVEEQTQVNTSTSEQSGRSSPHNVPRESDAERSVSLDSNLEKSIREQFDLSETQLLMAKLRKAEELGLPPEVLRNSIRAGIAEQKSPQQIIAQVSQQAEHLKSEPERKNPEPPASGFQDNSSAAQRAERQELQTRLNTATRKLEHKKAQQIRNLEQKRERQMRKLERKEEQQRRKLERQRERMERKLNKRSK